MNVLVITEHFAEKLKEGTLSALTCARQILEHTGGKLFILVAGHNISSIAEEMSCYGAEEVLVVQDERLSYLAPDGPFKDLIVSIVKDLNCEAVIAANSSFAKDFLPRVAAKLDAGMVSDVMGISFKDEELLFDRYIYAGNIIATVKINSDIKVISIRQNNFDKVDKQRDQSAVRALALSGDSVSKIKFIKLEITKSLRPELQGAKMVVAVGRGVKNKEGLRLIEEFADLFGAALGASRAAVDCEEIGMPSDLQVGQTGKIVAPDLYIAVGISGAIQHLAGIKDSKIIVAINKDPEAPIFQYSDFGIVGDLREVIPALTEEIKKLKS